MTIQNTTLFKCRRINQRFVLLTPLRTNTACLHVCATVAVTVTTTAATTVTFTVTVTVTVTISVPFFKTWGNTAFQCIPGTTTACCKQKHPWTLLSAWYTAAHV